MRKKNGSIAIVTLFLVFISLLIFIYISIKDRSQENQIVSSPSPTATHGPISASPSVKPTKTLTPSQSTPSPSITPLFTNPPTTQTLQPTSTPTTKSKKDSNSPSFVGG